MRAPLAGIILLGAALLVPLASKSDGVRQEIDDEVARLMRQHETPGVSVAVIHDHKLDWARGYGVREAGQAQPVDTDTVFQAASISKPVTAIAVLTLVEQGKLNLDEDVNGSLQSWKVPSTPLTAEAKVTLRRLLSHRAGLNVHGFSGYAGGKPVPTLLQVLNGAAPANSARIAVAVQPGNKYQYSGGGYCVVQQLLADVTKKSFPAFMETAVLAPARMERSTFAQQLPDQRRANMAAGHRKDGRVLPGQCHVYPEMAAAGLWTTPADLARLLVDLDNTWSARPGKLLSQKMTQDMLAGQGDSNRGLGWAVEGKGEELVFSHGGVNEGYRCMLIARPGTGNGVIVMTNSDQGDKVHQAIVKLVRTKYRW